MLPFRTKILHTRLPFYKKYFGVGFTKKIELFFEILKKKNDFCVQTLGVVFTLLNRFSSDKKKHLSLFFKSSLTYFSFIKIGGGHLARFPCKCGRNCHIYIFFICLISLLPFYLHLLLSRSVI